MASLLRCEGSIRAPGNMAAATLQNAPRRAAWGVPTPEPKAVPVPSARHSRCGQGQVARRSPRVVALRGVARALLRRRRGAVPEVRPYGSSGCARSLAAAGPQTRCSADPRAASEPRASAQDCPAAWRRESADTSVPARARWPGCRRRRCWAPSRPPKASSRSARRSGFVGTGRWRARKRRCLGRRARRWTSTAQGHPPWRHCGFARSRRHRQRCPQKRGRRSKPPSTTMGSRRRHLWQHG
mmetsp:Transcript_46594/g.134218  ORF Transcript_46594/g.134218 Transcript_46594/m.134218 type:complete len:241 (-) Transcript_46594:377-1099(-)